MKFVICKHCGQIIAFVKETKVPVICCGDPMEELIAGRVDAAIEKHVPVFKHEGNIVTVSVGQEEHPMLENHYIEWIAIQTKFGNQRKELKPGDNACAKFSLLDNDSVDVVYAYCNLHGLWKKENH